MFLVKGSCCAVVMEDVQVDGSSREIVPVNLVSEKGEVVSVNGTWIMEGSPDLQKTGAMLARAIVNSKDGLAPAQLVSIGRSVQLSKGTKIAVRERVESGTVAIVDSEHADPPTVARTQAGAKKLMSILDLSKSDLSETQWKDLESVVLEYRELFVTSDIGVSCLGRTQVAKHSIITTDPSPIKQQTRRIPHAVHSEVQRQVSEMLDGGIIQYSTSPWSSPIVMVRKKDGSHWFCIDFRKLNNVRVKDAYPLPRIDETLDALGGVKYFSTVGLISGYWQVEVDDRDKEKTAFSTGQGHYEFNVMKVWLDECSSNLSTTYGSCVGWHAVQYQECLVYLDDVIVFCYFRGAPSSATVGV